jgi:glycosyltransferase involved in cell wall biosynthesis
MRVLLLSDRIPPTKGGAEEVAWSLACALRDRGDELHVVTATTGIPTTEARDGITVHSIRAAVPDRWRAYLSLYNPQAVNAFRQVLDRVRPDVVNAHNIHVDLSYGCLTAAKRKGIPVVLMAHDAMAIGYEKLQHYVSPSHCPPASLETYRIPAWHNLLHARLRYNPLRNLWIRRIVTSTAAICVAPSETLRLALESNGLPGFRVVPYGVDGGKWETDPHGVTKLRSRLRLLGRRMILMAGRLGKAKGAPQALAALAHVVEAVPEATLMVLSDRQLDLGSFEHLHPEHVCFAGWMTGKDLAAAFRLSELVIVPSVYLDALVLVNIEAMASRKPVIATCHGGSPEVVVDGVTGFIVNPFDTPRFASRIIEVLTDKALRDRMGEAGFKRFQAEFTLERYAERMSSIFHEART